MPFVGDVGWTAIWPAATTARPTLVKSWTLLSGDLIAFGVAPTFFALGIATREWKMDYGAVLALMLYLICGACRLARYDPTVQKAAFKGMPIPAARLAPHLPGHHGHDSRPFFLPGSLDAGLLDGERRAVHETGLQRNQALPAHCVRHRVCGVSGGVAPDCGGHADVYSLLYLAINLGTALGGQLQGRREREAEA